ASGMAGAPPLRLPERRRLAPVELDGHFVRTTFMGAAPAIGCSGAVTLFGAERLTHSRRLLRPGSARRPRPHPRDVRPRRDASGCGGPNSAHASPALARRASCAGDAGPRRLLAAHLL